MERGIKVAAFHGGEFRFMKSDAAGREVVLALPLSRLLVRMVKVPIGEDAIGVATPILKSISPYPDDPLAVSCEVVRETSEAKIVLAAALPESAADDIAEALDAMKLNVLRIDALAIGALRGIWGKLNITDESRRLIILKSPDCLTLMVLDGDQPVSIRSIPDETDIKRETWLSLLEAEDFNGPKELVDTIEHEIELESALTGIFERTIEIDTINALPDSWREVLEESRFKTKMTCNLSIAGVLWGLILLVLFGVPFVYGFMTDHVKDMIRGHSREYKAVADKKAKTELVRRYSDHARGALEIMKAVSDRLPQGVTLTDWRFTRENGVVVRGEADDKEQIYQFKDNLVAMEVFDRIALGAVNYQANRHKFEITCSYEGEEE